MSSPSPFLFSPPPLCPTATITPTTSAHGGLDSVIDNDGTMLALLDSFFTGPEGPKTAVGGADADTLSEPSVVAGNHGNGISTSAKTIKPTKHIPTINLATTTQSFYIDPILCLPTPVDDKGSLSLEIGAYIPPLVPANPYPQQGLPTPATEKYERGTNLTDSVLDPALRNTSGSSTNTNFPKFVSSSSVTKLNLPTPAMSRSSSNSSSSPPVTPGDMSSQAELPKVVLSGTQFDISLTELLDGIMAESETDGTTKISRTSLPPDFPTCLPLSYPAKTGVPVLNAKSQAVGWDCGPATLSIFDNKYGPPPNGPLTRDVQSYVVGGAPDISINWRLYDEGRRGSRPSYEPVKPEPSNSMFLEVPTVPKRRKRTPKPSSSRSASPAQSDANLGESAAEWKEYYQALEVCKKHDKLESVRTPFEPECLCPFPADEKEEVN
ncbi:hypothetical protein DACRYDRAFT_116658 [Dacryopinax primogenitus]|uniref:Uncharacterized protein n=1 Tax=Dacryopinax primogenitus (strain DJM 731) TaxID=1858805 RepID=M5FYA5_DACPD|nr:uncharacterized protein DACRYDRAFT_116658 [Dacryopinax primogenitus]EJU01514.1 hypothetical protein DACRYDRAFT_116658 [Dacryopinax primogenitus]